MKGSAICILYQTLYLLVSSISGYVESMRAKKCTRNLSRNPRQHRRHLCVGWNNIKEDLNKYGVNILNGFKWVSKETIGVIL
jgi:hypothetical protein